MPIQPRVPAQKQNAKIAAVGAVIKMERQYTNVGVPGFSHKRPKKISHENKKKK